MVAALRAATAIRSEIVNDAHPAPRAGLLWLAFAAFVVYGIPGSALGVVWLELRAEFAKTLEALGQLLALLTLGNLLTSAPVGRLIERWGLGRTCLGGSLLMLLGLGGFALSSGWGTLLASTFVMGLGMGVLNPALNAFVAHYYPASRMSWLHVSYGLGSALGPLLITLLVLQAGYSWRLAFAVIAALQLLLSTLIALTLPGWRLEPSAEDAQVAPPGLAESLRLPLVWLGVALYFVHNGLSTSAGQLSGTLLAEARGFPTAAAGFWVSLYFFGVLASRVLLGLVGDRFAAAAILRASAAGAVLGALLLWWNPAPALSLAGLVLLGLALATVYPLGISRTPELVGRRHSASAIGFQIAGGALGAAFAPWLIGRLSTGLGPEAIAAALLAMALVQFAVHEGVLWAEARARRARALA